MGTMCQRSLFWRCTSVTQPWSEGKQLAGCKYIHPLAPRLFPALWWKVENHFFFHWDKRRVEKCYHASSCRLCDLLLAGAIMNQVLQPHEAHIPFPLQVSHTFALPSKAPARKYSHLYLTSVHDRLQFVWNELHPPVGSEISTGRRLAHFVFWIPLFLFFWSSTITSFIEKSFSQGSQGHQSLASPLTPSPMFCSPSQAFWDVDNLPRLAFVM